MEIGIGMKKRLFISSFVIRRLSFVIRYSLFYRSFLTLLLLAMLSGCLTSDKEFTRPLAGTLQRDPLHTARINCFLILKDNKGQAIRLENRLVGNWCRPALSGRQGFTTRPLSPITLDRYQG